MDISSLTYLGGCFNLSFLLGITAILPQSLATVLASSRYLSDLPVSIKRAASSRQLFKSPAIFSAFSPAAVLPTSITPDKISASAASFSLLFSRYSICLSSTVVKISPSVLSETMVSIASAEDSIYSFNAFLASVFTGYAVSRIFSIALLFCNSSLASSLTSPFLTAVRLVTTSESLSSADFNCPSNPAFIPKKQIFSISKIACSATACGPSKNP